MGSARPFTKPQRQRASQTGFGHRPVNNWGEGDLPAPWAEGDLVLLPDGGPTDRLRGMGPGYFVVSCAFSINEGDAWYFRVADWHGGSDRLHVGWAARSDWTSDFDWMAPFELVETADPAGLKRRCDLLAAGWSFPVEPRCPACGQRTPSAVEAVE